MPATLASTRGPYRCASQFWMCYSRRSRSSDRGTKNKRRHGGEDGGECHATLLRHCVSCALCHALSATRRGRVCSSTRQEPGRGRAGVTVRERRCSRLAVVQVVHGYRAQGDECLGWSQGCKRRPAKVGSEGDEVPMKFSAFALPLGIGETKPCPSSSYCALVTFTVHIHNNNNNSNNNARLVHTVD